jgi:signal transduction histidine kinase
MAARGTTAESTFPVVVALEAIDAWMRDPTGDRRVFLSQALESIVRAAGAAGALLEFEASPLPAFRGGFGTLRGVANGREPEAADRYPLTANGGRVELGTLWLDGGGQDAPFAARALELALDAAWARAQVGATADRLEALDAATRAIAGVLDLDTVLQLISDRVRELVGAQYAALGVVDRNGLIERFITSGIGHDERERIGDPPTGRGLLGLIIREGRSFRIADIGAHEDSSGFPANHPPMGSFLGVPVTVARGSTGNLYLTNKQGATEFSADDERLVEMFALHAGIAIETARLHQEVQQLAIVGERDRIAKDLHDGIIQAIYAVVLSLDDVPDLMRTDVDEATARIDRAIDYLNLAIRNIRNFILALSPESAGGQGLVPGLAALADEVRLNTLMDVELEVASTDDHDARVDDTSASELLQMAREVLSNAARHSRGTRLRIRLSVEAADTVLEIVDDGRGFDPERARASGHFGLINLVDRASAIGGDVAIESGDGRGTRVLIRIPAAAVVRTRDPDPIR